ncbi:aldo/keto reductase [Frondihabitans australicus]|uniref:Aryl-alcohol dehydrogenase-like predicted oxidoreductase n=1 Tax=Frondihabitans australicus TaxID=386892 RepID=A0A495IBC6_9MICO|nr:aldo/keto reductase [Frondihabitans australicus]RKR73303.1 aryl-alcohol dehydrogenase-like predicted oxidoreductase [Frondihabitans australicus]
MQYRQIGSSDLRVSEIALGSWVTFAGGVGFDTTRACTEAAFDAGITFFDTANMYGRGEAERAWGEILSTHPRDSYVLATKVWGPMSDTDSGLSGAQIAKQIDASLERLQTDHVDLYYAHRFDTHVPIEETIEAFQRVVDQGKARHIGFSEWLPEQIEAAIELAGPELFVASQPQYSMLWRAPEARIFDLSSGIGVSQVVWSPLAQGILTGKYLPGEPFPEGSRAADPEQARFFDLVLRPGVLEAVQRLVPIADGLGITLAQLALAWALRRSEVAAVITGASRPEQVHANASAAGTALDAATLAAIDDALGEVSVTEPVPAMYVEPGVLHR